MASLIDPNKPTPGVATTQSVRDNFQHAKDEIEALQDALAAGVNDQAPILSSIAGISADQVGLLQKTGASTIAIVTLTNFAKSILAATSAAAVRTILGLGTAAVANVGDFAAATHSHNAGDLPTLTGDSGSGGSAGIVPAPVAGDGAGSKFLMADGSWHNLKGSAEGDINFQSHKAISPELNRYGETYKNDGTVSTATYTVDYQLGSFRRITVGANVAISFSNWPAGQGAAIVLWIKQDPTGGRNPTFPGVKWPGGGLAPTIAAGAGQETVFTIVSDGTSVYGFNGGLNFA